jgi:S1-C subfamily serine protease
MKRKKSIPSHFLMSGGLSRIIPAFICAIIYICGNVLAVPTTYASGVPGGNISDPVVRAVDIAKPAVVRIVAKVTGRLTVDFPTNTGTILTVTFPQTGGRYEAQYTGSGAFISAHGDILTADHLVEPPPDLLYETAAQDIANFVNAHSNQPITPAEVLTQLSNGLWKSQAQYNTPTMRVYLSTDFTGPTNNAPTLVDMPPGTYADADSIRKTRDFEHGDTAIIHVNMPDTPSIKLGDSTNVEPQDQLTMLGFPGNGDILIQNARTLTDAASPSSGFLTVSLNKVYVSALKQTPDGAPLIQVGGNVEHGDSGGPVLDNNGNVIGVASFIGSDAPSGTGFLQASSTAQQMVNELHLDTQPGKFESAWSQAFTEYSSTEAGHWHLAQQQMQKLQANYPKFHAIQSFLNYATTQASKETTTSTSPSPSTNLSLVIGIALFALMAIFLVVFLARRKKGPQVALATQSAPYQSLYGSAREIEPTSPSASMVPVDLKDAASQDSSPIPASQLSQPLAMQSPPPMPQAATPVASYPANQLSQPLAMQSPPPMPQAATPVASYNASPSGPAPVVPSQPLMNLEAQQLGYGSASIYEQQVPYGQQPYNTAPQPRPVQATPYPPYSSQQYVPYPQAPVPPWPSAPTNMPLPRARGPYTPQNPAQQGAPMQYGQQLPNYGMPYSQAPQGYGVMPASAQPQPAQPTQSSQPFSEPIPAQPQRASAPLIPYALSGSEEQTVKVDQWSRSALGKIAKPTEGTENRASSMPFPPKDETQLSPPLSEGDAPTELGEKQ